MKFGYQLFSALALCQDQAGMISTMEKIAEMGYDGVEFFSYAGVPAAEMKALLERLHLKGFNSHVQLERWEKDAEGEIRYAAEAGIPCVTIPWMPPEMRNDAGFAKIKQMIPHLIALCRQYGVQLIYHNHDFEFAKKEDGQFVLEDILSADPAVGLELDTFWVHYAGVDPVGYMETHKDRMRLIHIKDYLKFDGGPIAGGVEMPTFCAIGTGKMQNQPIINWAEANGIEWVCVEQDNSQIPELEAAKISIDTLKGSKQ